MVDVQAVWVSSMITRVVGWFKKVVRDYKTTESSIDDVKRDGIDIGIYLAARSMSIWLQPINQLIFKLSQVRNSKSNGKTVLLIKVNLGNWFLLPEPEFGHISHLMPIIHRLTYDVRITCIYFLINTSRYYRIVGILSIHKELPRLLD